MCGVERFGVVARRGKGGRELTRCLPCTETVWCDTMPNREEKTKQKRKKTGHVSAITLFQTSESEASRHPSRRTVHNTPTLTTSPQVWSDAQAAGKVDTSGRGDWAVTVVSAADERRARDAMEVKSMVGVVLGGGGGWWWVSECVCGTVSG
jgi:hypothetical protein